MIRTFLTMFLVFSISVPVMAEGPMGAENLQPEAMNLPACPETPNCVSSLAADPARRVEPFPLVGGPSHSIETLVLVVNSFPRTKIVSRSGSDLQVEFRSILGFVDDLLFKVSAEENVIHVRSAARTGYWDLGVNRRRVERIRKRYLSQP